jgi:hypothetical protein
MTDTGCLYRSRPIYRRVGSAISNDRIPPPVGISLPRKVIGGFIGLAALASLMLAVTAGWLTPQHSATVEGISRTVFGVVAVILGYAAVRILTRLPLQRPRQSPAYKSDIDWLARLQDEMSEPRLDHEPGAIITFMEVITHPSRYRSRVTETIDLDRRSINKQVSIEFVLPKNNLPDKLLYLPVAQIVVGDPEDSFRLTDGSNGAITQLTYLEMVELAAIGLRTLLLAATGKKYQEWASTRAAELIMLELIARRRPSLAKSAKSSMKKALKLLEGNPSSGAKKVIRAYVRSLSAGYPIVVTVPTGLVVSNHITIRYERTDIPTIKSVTWEDRLRLGIGLRPSQLTVPIDLASTSDSYHLRVNGPPGMYVAEQLVRCGQCHLRLDDLPVSATTQSKHTPGNSPDPHFSLRRRLGQDFTDLYMRGYANSEHQHNRYELLVRYNETPPGSIALATIIAFGALALIWIIGYLASNNAEITNSDLPAIFLTLPALAASFVGPSSSGKTLIGSSVHARLSLIFSGFLSVASVVIYLLRNAASGAPANPIALRTHMTLAGVRAPLWIALLMLAFFGFIYIAWHLLARTRNYTELISRMDPLKTHHLM